MLNGYYKLTADVTNPRPDRRSKRYDSREVWPADTLVFVVDTRAQEFEQAERIAGERLPEAKNEGQPRGYIRFPDLTQIHFNLSPGKDAKRYPEYVQGNGIIPVLAPAERTLGIVLKEADWDASGLLAVLLELGKLKLADIDAVKHYDPTPPMDKDDDEKRDWYISDLQKRHGI